ncbi:MarR family winged helix-turn-helix transcriptional regulator [Bacteroidota bacterium]
MKFKSRGGFLLSKIHQLAGRIFAKMLRNYNLELNPAQGRIMFVLWQKDGIPIQELAKETSLGKSTLTSMLDRLEKGGYVKRVPSPADRRTILIKRTKKDEAHKDEYIKVSDEITNVFYKGFSSNELKEFEKFLDRIFGNLTAYDKDNK